jgi:ABC-type transport system involved in cytochrome bd biosynthesis fused ATPase/permease subunit
VTLKVYGSDKVAHQQMDEQAESFRRRTLRVLRMQLSSIAIMDLVAFGGMTAGLIIALNQFWLGALSVGGCLTILFLIGDFLVPLRQLGSLFHVAMTGVASAARIVNILNIEETPDGEQSWKPTSDTSVSIQFEGASYAYNERFSLAELEFCFRPGINALVGESGSGKSTIARILAGRASGYSGKISLQAKTQAGVDTTVELRDVKASDLVSSITLVTHDSHLFATSVRDNLLLAGPLASDEELWNVLEQVQLAQFLRTTDGLETVLSEGASNLSGGQRQRLALARALLRNTPVYIFDEITSNVDVESEEAIMACISRLAFSHTVLLISHRLANVQSADTIFVLEGGRCTACGTHDTLLAQKSGLYARLLEEQQRIERLVVEKNDA